VFPLIIVGAIPGALVGMARATYMILSGRVVVGFLSR